MQEEFLLCKQLPGGKKSSEIFKVIDNFFREHDIPWPKCVARCAMTHCMLHRENVVAKDMNDEFSNVRSLTRYEIFHPYLSFSSYSILCPSLIEYRVTTNCKGEQMSIINRINCNELCVTDDLQLCVGECECVCVC